MFAGVVWLDAMRIFIEQLLRNEMFQKYNHIDFIKDTDF